MLVLKQLEQWKRQQLSRERLKRSPQQLLASQQQPQRASRNSLGISAPEAVVKSALVAASHEQHEQHEPLQAQQQVLPRLVQAQLVAAKQLQLQRQNSRASRQPRAAQQRKNSHFAQEVPETQTVLVCLVSQPLKKHWDSQRSVSRSESLLICAGWLLEARLVLQTAVKRAHR